MNFDLQFLNALQHQYQLYNKKYHHEHMYSTIILGRKISVELRD